MSLSNASVGSGVKFISSSTPQIAPRERAKLEFVACRQQQYLNCDGYSAADFKGEILIRPPF